jgi:molecular chaperone GrpE
MSNETRHHIPITEDDSAPAEGAESGGTATAAAPGSAPETVETQLAGAQTEIEKFKDRALRAQADFENFRKRSAREKEEAVRYANVDLLERLIPILDNFELGLSAARTSSEGSAILAGMEMVGRQLSDFLRSNGVEPIAAEGEKFDPNVHDAVAQEANGDVPEGHVIRQHRRGFKLKDRLIRPAAVVVSKGPTDK